MNQLSHDLKLVLKSLICQILHSRISQDFQASSSHVARINRFSRKTSLRKDNDGRQEKFREMLA